MAEKPQRVRTDSNHQVQFYESDEYLAEVVGRYVAAGLTAGQPVVVIATPEHCKSFTSALKLNGADVDNCVRLGQLTFLDARHTLSTFIVDGTPNGELFKTHIGAVIEKASAGRPGVRVRAFGEMVDLLRHDGNPEAAVRLEELWNELATTYEFSLLCAYSMDSFNGEAYSREFERVCGQHAHVTPTEQYMKAPDDSARLQGISLLQQRARSLESEIETRKALEESLRQLVSREQAARSEAEKASRLKDEFLAVLSHELRTPLNAILGWTQIIESRNEPKTLAKALDVIRRNAKLQLSLINDLLDVSRIISGKMVLKSEPVDLGQVAKASLDTVRPAAITKGIELEVAVQEATPFIAGDADRLQQVLWNLLTNAIKFTPKNGKVELRLEQDDSQLLVIVRDTGVGIDPQFLPYVFDRFRQADTATTRKVGGLGLGLAVVRYLVEAHGGSVSAESPGAGLGATFIVKFPISVERRADPTTNGDRRQTHAERISDSHHR
jgi:signal transduction histidine kinase